MLIGDGAAHPNRVGCVEHEVEEHLLELREVEAHGRQVVGELAADSYRAWQDPAVDHLLPRHDLVHVQHLGLQDLGAGSYLEQLAGEDRGAIGRADDCRDVAALLGARRHGEQLGVPGQHREEVVEIVRQPAGEPPDAFQLPRPPQSFVLGASSVMSRADDAVLDLAGSVHDGFAEAGEGAAAAVATGHPMA